MKRLPLFLTILALMLSALFTTPANAKSETLMIVYFAQPIDRSASTSTRIVVALPSTISTDNGAYNMKQPVETGQPLTLVTWSGPATGAPDLYVRNLRNDDTIALSHCPGIDTTIWICAAVGIDIAIDFNQSECPWNITMYSVNSDSISGKTWTSPPSRETACEPVPVATYDISWSPASVQHDKQLILKSTGDLVETTLHTYLMESGSLCDNSLMTSRGAYCRFVSTGVSVSLLGCDDSLVTTTMEKHPMTDKELFDIHVQVNTQQLGVGTLSATCNFRYLIDEL